MLNPLRSEDEAFRLLGLKWAGADSAKVQRLIKGVLALQRADGGWAQTPYLTSDAFATGTALNALHEAGMSTSSAEYRKGAAFQVTADDVTDARQGGPELQDPVMLLLIPLLTPQVVVPVLAPAGRVGTDGLDMDIGIDADPKRL